MNLRALAEGDLRYTLEGDFSSTITLISPNGAKQIVKGRVRWSQPRTNLQTGEVVNVPDPVVTIRKSSLSVIPAEGENWAVIIPDGPRSDAAPITMLLDKTRTLDGGKTLGMITLRLVNTKQTEVN